MVRTKGDGAGRAVGAKSLSKTLSSPGASSSRANSATCKSTDKYGGGNAYCPRPTPPWQKEISTFFTAKPKDSSESSELGEGSSTQTNGHDDDRE